MKAQQLEVRIQGDTAEILFRRQPILFIGVKGSKVYVAPKSIRSVEWVKQLPKVLDPLNKVAPRQVKAPVKQKLDPIVVDLLDAIIKDEPSADASRRLAKKHKKTVYQIAGVRSSLSKGNYGDRARLLAERRRERQR